jgi:hypothetical protein
MNVLIICYQLNSTYHIYINRIYIKQESMSKLVSIIKPYIISSMLYKFNLLQIKN